MSSLGQWFFEKEKQSILRAVERRAPYVAKVSAVAGGNKVRIIDPFTQTSEAEVLTVVGPLPLAGQNVMVMPLRDGERVVFRIPDPIYHSTYTNSVAIGNNASPTWWDAVAIGDDTQAFDRSVAIGEAARATDNYTTAIGYGAIASSDDAIALGYASNAAHDRAIAIGRSALAELEGGVGIGYTARPGRLAVAIGYQVGQAEVTGELSVSIGYWAKATAIHAIAIGRATTASAVYTIALGYMLTASGVYAMALGSNTSVTSDYGINIGYSGVTSGLRSVGMGYNTTVGGSDSITIGTNATAPHTETIAIGMNASPPLAATTHIATARLYVYRGASSSGLVLKSPDGSQWMITVGNNGVVGTTKL